MTEFQKEIVEAMQGCVKEHLTKLFEKHQPQPFSKVWDERFLDLAHHVAGWSKDPSTKVGAVIVRPDKTVASMGFNGFPRGIADDERLQDRAQKYPIIVHAEINALLMAQEPLKGFGLYTWPLPPCAPCAALIIQAGITRVVAPVPGDRWLESCRLGCELMNEAGIQQEWCEDAESS